MILIRRPRDACRSSVEGAPKPKMLPELKEGLALRRAASVPACDRRLHRDARTSSAASSFAIVHPLHGADARTCRRSRSASSSPGSASARSSGAARDAADPEAVGVGRRDPRCRRSSLGRWRCSPFRSRRESSRPRAASLGTLAVRVRRDRLQHHAGQPRQAITPERLQGRMNAAMRWIVWGTIPLGTLSAARSRPAYQPARGALGRRDRARCSRSSRSPSAPC